MRRPLRCNGRDAIISAQRLKRDRVAAMDWSKLEKDTVQCTITLSCVQVAVEVRVLTLPRLRSAQAHEPDVLTEPIFAKGSGAVQDWCPGLMSLKKEVITMERLYKFIKNNIAYIRQSNRVRRFVYLLCKNDRLDDKAYFKAIINQADGGIHLDHYLMSIDLERFHPQIGAPMTKEKSDMQKSAIEKPIQWLIECVTNSTINNIFQKSQIEKTPDTLEFVPIDDMLSKFTQWMIEESRDASSYTRDRFSKTMGRILGANCKKQVNRVRQRGYDLSVNSLRETIIKYT
ncbi:unnamed protein product [Phytophthora lilii]|uniref:Unnamed protein product n=1 Tax=Phytophthora lilii TaxID=2077276 RepID=A0A9W6X1T5_9STRA|nr:unnamed protein product [Phytophthora lilii]